MLKDESHLQVPKVHQGFNAAVHTVLPTIKGLVDTATGGDKSWRIYVTGHSLGAALATIAAYRLATRCECAPLPSRPCFGRCRLCSMTNVDTIPGPVL